MTLYELGTEYRRRSDVLRAKVNILRENLASVPENERATLLRRIHSLYADAEHCRELARHLTAYYTKGEMRFIGEKEELNNDKN